MLMPKPDASIIARKAQISARLRAALPPDIVFDEPTQMRVYECDALTVYRCAPLAVALPRSTAEVAIILQIRHDEGIPVIPRGAGTSLAGGALPTADAVILGTSRLKDVITTDTDNRYIHVQTGRTNLSVSAEVEESGFFYAPDPSSQLACAIAGNIAMNSGGGALPQIRCDDQQPAGRDDRADERRDIANRRAVYGCGGLDLLGLICGSEGQLGVVTEAWLRILPKPEGARPALIAFDSNEAAGACVAAIIKAGILSVAIEFMDRPCIIATERFAKAGYPDCEALLIVEVEGSPTEIDAQLKMIREIASRYKPKEIREAADAAQAARIWLGRKSAFGAMGQMADYMCLDGTIPVSELPNVLRRIEALSQDFGLQVTNVFHAGDGNMHPLILFNANKEGDLEKCEALGAEILKLCVEVGGCLTGEHGVGVEKRDLMHVQFSRDDLEAQLRVKDVFDPKWLLNPAKVFPLDVTKTRRNGVAHA